MIIHKYTKIKILFCYKKKPRKPAFSGLFWRREQDLSRGEASGERSNTVAKRCVAKRYVISLSCSRSIEKGLPLQAFVWRREQDLNLRRLLTSHAFQFPNFVYFLHKKMLFYVFLHYFSQIF